MKKETEGYAQPLEPVAVEPYGDNEDNADTGHDEDSQPPAKKVKIDFVHDETKQLIEDLRKRVVCMESRAEVEKTCTHQEVKDERVKTLRLLMADSVLRNTCQLPRPGGERNNYRYSSILASGTTEHTFETDYKLMIYMVQ